MSIVINRIVIFRMKIFTIFTFVGLILLSNILLRNALAADFNPQTGVLTIPSIVVLDGTEAKYQVELRLVSHVKPVTFDVIKLTPISVGSSAEANFNPSNGIVYIDNLTLANKFYAGTMSLSRIGNTLKFTVEDTAFLKRNISLNDVVTTFSDGNLSIIGTTDMGESVELSGKKEDDGVSFLIKLK